MYIKGGIRQDNMPQANKHYINKEQFNNQYIVTSCLNCTPQSQVFNLTNVLPNMTHAKCYSMCYPTNSLLGICMTLSQIIHKADWEIT